MKYLYRIIFGFLSLQVYAEAQSFALKIDNREQTVLTNTTVEALIEISATGGYTADVFLKATSSSLTLAENALKTTTARATYPQTVMLTYHTLPQDTGFHKIIVEGKNGPITSVDTLFLTIKPQSGWKVFEKIVSPPRSFVFPDGESVLFNMAIRQNEFLGKFSNNQFTYQPGWENMGILYGVESPLIFDKDKNLWAGSSSGIGKFDGTFWTTFPLAYKMSTLKGMMLDSSNSIWYWTENETAPWYVGSVRKISDGKSISLDTVFKKIVPGMSNFKINGMTTDKSGNIWVIVYTHNSGNGISTELYKFDGTSWTSFTYPFKSVNSSSRYITLDAITTDRNNGIWVTYTYAPVSPDKGNTYLLHYDGSEWKSYESNFYGAVSKIITDNNDNVWMLLGANLIQFKEGIFTVFNSKNSPIPTGGGGIAIAADPYDNIWTAWGGNSMIVYNPSGLNGELMATSIKTDDKFADDFNSLITPNPAREFTTIHYSLKAESPVSISIYNSLGIEVFKNELGFKNSGDNTEIISTSELPSGQYYYVLKAGAQQSTHPLVVVR